MPDSSPLHASRRSFAAALAGAVVTPLLAQQAPTSPNASTQNTSAPPKDGPPPEVLPFGSAIDFTRKPKAPKIEPFAMTEVRLLPGVYYDSQRANLHYLKRLKVDRLLHNFRVTAGLPSSAQPLAGWEAPDCEVRGHFVGHYLSACALMYASTGDNEMKSRGNQLVTGLFECQQKLGGEYLSAFPLEFFDRLKARKNVWAPFYTIHKIMAGLLDMHQYAGSRQALEVLEGMAHWADNWTAPIPDEHMQDILNTEYGGMSEVLYNLAAVTGNERYATAGDRFLKKKFFNPLALRRDELRGLHVNTHIPQVIGAARRYELSGDERFHDVADFFWWEVTGARTYVTGGTSNGESWLLEPRRLGAELKKGADTTECCCAYNMLKLTRHLYQWTGDPRYFDYYERTLLNHRIAAIDRESGATQYYLSIAPGAWKTFNTETASFWCCTGTGVEEFSKLNDSIYFHDRTGLYVNLFVASELDWKARKIKIRQETRFPEQAGTTLVIVEPGALGRMPLHIRMPYWIGSDARVSVNGKQVEVTPSPGSYFTINRQWRKDDRIDIVLPMHLHIEAMPDEPTTQAFLYGPLVLAGTLGASGLTEANTIGPEGPDVAKNPIDIPALHALDPELAAWLKPVVGDSLTFRTTGQYRDITFTPLARLFGKRYSVYWTVS